MIRSKLSLSFLVAFIMLTFVVVIVIQQTVITQQTLGEQKNTNLVSTSNPSKFLLKLKTTDSKISSLNNPNVIHDDMSPIINISSPAYIPAVATGKKLLQGTARDLGSGIRNVSAAVYVFPFSDQLRKNFSSLTIPVLPNNWSQWSFPFVINKTGTYMVQVEAIDNAGNRNYARTIMNAPFSEKNGVQINTPGQTLQNTPKIAFVRPTFTEAAYQMHGFYDFYSKNRYLPYGKNITTDLDMLTVRIPKSVLNFDPRYTFDISSLIPVNGTESHDVSRYSPNPQKFWMTFINHVQDVVSDSIVTVMRDEDVHDGYLFYTYGENLTEAYHDNNKNAYDVLVLFSNEYVTQKEYDNLRQFVGNGGTIVFIDASEFNTEVRYDKDHGTIRLIKGHGWEFDGKAAKRSVAERWYNETKDWVGSNNLISDINDRITFLNNPFNYFMNNAFNHTHFEEQYVNNPKVKLIIDYAMKYSPINKQEDPYFKGKKVASYTLEYGKGKIVMLGLSGRFLSSNEKFMRFFDNGILPKALCPKFQSCVLGNSQKDITRPSVNITNPPYPPTVTTGKFIIQGSAQDFDSGIHNVTAYAHTFPFDGHYNVKFSSQPVPTSTNNWSRWSVPLVINQTGTYRVLIEARDNAGNLNWAETTINAPINAKKNTDARTNPIPTKEDLPKIAFVRPTFTEAAYQEHGFYRFDSKYGYLPYGKNVTTDLDMLTVKTPKSVSEFLENDIRHLSPINSLIPINGTELHEISSTNFPYKQRFWLPFIDRVENFVPNATITIMRDEDVHDGHLFYQDNKTNAYDMVLLFHSEYVTQSEYDNLKQFVKNGGVLILIDANVFYAEVRYDRNNHTITLVEGHDKKFDGKAATRSVPERWYNETKGWVGSNFLNIDTNETVTFANNPFNYTHVEEQFVNNPKAKIITDYGIKIPKDSVESYLKNKKIHPELQQDIPIDDVKVATYSLDYGKGKVIMLGLFGEKLVHNQSFVSFFYNLIVKLVLVHLSKQ